MNDYIVSIENFLGELELPKDYYNNLLNEDDWGFIIKLSALLEAVTSNLLVKKFDKECLKEAFTFLDYANGKYGKIKLLYDMEVIDKTQYKILRAFAELRNSVVHNVSNVSFSFEQMIKKFTDDKQHNKIVELYGYGLTDTIEIKEIKVKKRDFVLDNVKIAIWITIGEIIGCLHLDKEFEEYKKKLSFTITPKED